MSPPRRILSETMKLWTLSTPWLELLEKLPVRLMKKMPKREPTELPTREDSQPMRKRP